MNKPNQWNNDCRQSYQKLSFQVENTSTVQVNIETIIWSTMKSAQLRQTKFYSEGEITHSKPKYTLKCIHGVCTVCIWEQKTVWPGCVWWVFWYFPWPFENVSTIDRVRCMRLYLSIRLLVAQQYKCHHVEIFLSSVCMCVNTQLSRHQLVVFEKLQQTDNQMLMCARKFGSMFKQISKKKCLMLFSINSLFYLVVT